MIFNQNHCGESISFIDDKIAKLEGYLNWGVCICRDEINLEICTKFDLAFKWNKHGDDGIMMGFIFYGKNNRRTIMKVINFNRAFSNPSNREYGVAFWLHSGNHSLKLYDKNKNCRSLTSGYSKPTDTFKLSFNFIENRLFIYQKKAYHGDNYFDIESLPLSDYEYEYIVPAFSLSKNAEIEIIDWKFHAW